MRPRHSQQRRFPGIFWSRTAFPAASLSQIYLPLIALAISLFPIFVPGLVRAEVKGSPERCRQIADHAARLNCFEAARSDGAEGAPPTVTGVGTWRLVRTPNPRGGPDAVSIMQTAELARSDVGLAGLMLRCGESGVDVLIVLLKPLPPRAQPRVVLTARGSTVEFRATVIPPGAAISLPGEAAALVNGAWQSSPELALEITENDNTIRGVVPLAGLAPALALLMSNCALRR
jgi:hypothetical protein